MYCVSKKWDTYKIINKIGMVINFCRDINFTISRLHTSRHKLPTQHGIIWGLLLIAIRAHHRVPSQSGGLGIVRVKSPQLLSPRHGVAGRGGSVGNVGAKERGEGVRIGGRSGIT